MRIPPAFLLAALLLAPTAQALIATTPNRFDLGEVDAGRTLELRVNVTNKGTTPVRLLVGATVFEAERAHVEPRETTLAPGETREVALRLELPANVSGGRHDPRLDFVEAPVEESAATVGRAAVSVPVVFRIRNLKIGNLEVPHVDVGESAQARVLVQNFFDAPVAPALALLVLDASGREVARRDAAGPLTEPNASASVALALPTEALKPGAYTVRGLARHGGAESNAWVAPLFVGERRLGVSDVSSKVDAKGVVTFTARVANLGNVALPATVSFAYGPRDGPTRSVDADAGTLAPGESRVVTAVVSPAPGAYDAVASAHWAGGTTESPPTSFTVKGAGAPAAPTSQRTPVPVALVAVALVAAALVLRRRE